MASVLGWIGEQRRVYFDNAPMVREYRTQLRGNRAPWILTVFLGLLIFMAVIVYWGISFAGDRSVTSMQGSLTGFFAAIIGMLEFMVAIIAPVVAASSIIGEYDRKSIELIFTSPMGAKYFLVGKLVSSYRYILMLIFLALPIAALAVVLGGATWKDVLSAFLIVSLHGLLYMAVSIPIAVMTAKSVTTVLLSYVANFVWVNLAAAVGGMSLRNPTEANPLIGLCPYFTSGASSAMVDFFGIKLNVWFSTLIVTFLLVKLLMVGAGSALTQGGSKETLGLRIHGLIYVALFGLIVGAGTAGGTTIPFSMAGPAWVTLYWPLTAFFIVCLPYLSTWSLTGGVKTRPNGIFNLRHLLRGTPASGLPYLTALLVFLALGQMGGALIRGQAPDLVSFVYLWAVFAAWGFGWSLGWAASAMTPRQGPESSRRLQLLFLFGACVLPAFALWIAENGAVWANLNMKEGWAEDLYLFSFITDDLPEAAIKAAVITFLALTIGAWAEFKRRAIVKKMRGMA